MGGKPRLTPPDLIRCQVEKGGAFMLGGGMVRCKNMATKIATEKERGEDGLVGSMSVCDGCALVLEERYPGRTTLAPIPPRVLGGDR